ncbi:unnamed protein product [Prorocentrum cordatum]|uniref:Uncharacterized protein n=1 Tax=Prorocentrum cordatum TaxID=2364126 RepID=A0ABN9RP39_9DINO|nr:unnamed protein product [Polarella glacialis]
MIVHYLPHQRSALVAFAIWLLFDIYGRPREIRELRLQDVAPPTVAASGARRFVSVTLHAQEVGDVSKTGEFDASARLDLERQTGLAAGRPAMAAARRREVAPATAPPLARRRTRGARRRALWGWRS